MLALTIIITLSVFSGCGSSGTATRDTSAVTESEKAPETTEPDSNSALISDFLIFDKDGAYCNIVTSLYAAKEENTAASNLNKALSAVSSAWDVSRIGNDYIEGQKKGESYDIKGKEILIGHTNRRESEEVKETLSREQFAVKVVGEKLVLIGYDEYATYGAVEYFINTYLMGEAMEELKINVGTEYIGKAGLRKVELNSEAAYRIMTYNLGLLVSADVNGEKECIDIITRHLPDVMGLQECNAKVHNKVLSGLPDFYAFANQHHNNSTLVNYTPIIYNKELFKCLKSDVIWLRGRYTGTNTKSLSWAVFEDNDGNKFALINFHGAVCTNSYAGFETYSKDQLSAQAKEWQLDNIAQCIEIKNAIIAEFGSIPVMISGDNNFNSSSQQYANLITAGFTDAEVTARISKMTGFKTSFGYGSIPGEGKSIDHIFGIGGVDFVTHAIVRGDDVWKASDHCSVYVDFNIN